MTNTPEHAIAVARTKHRPGLFSVGTCLMQVRICYGVAARFPSATKAWEGAKFKHATRSSADIPRGVPVFWTGGAKGFGHIAISLGDGLCETTDFVNRGGFGVARISDITIKWGLTFVGWTEDVNGVRVWTPPAPKPAEKPAPKPAHTTPYDQLYYGVLEVVDKYGPRIQSKYTARRRLVTALRAALKAAPKPRSAK